MSSGMIRTCIERFYECETHSWGAGRRRAAGGEMRSFTAVSCIRKSGEDGDSLQEHAAKFSQRGDTLVYGKGDNWRA